MARLELTFADIVRAICLRPKMYMMHGTFGEALAMLDGYANGRRLGNKGRSGSVFNPFRAWLAVRLDLKDGPQFWTDFRDKYGDDQTALDHLAEFWAEYEATSDKAEQYVL
jgi:hypothetical protein